MDLTLYNSWMLSICRSLYRLDSQDVADAFNDSLYLIHSTAKQFENEAHAYSFIRTTTRFYALNYMSGNKVRERRQDKLKTFYKIKSPDETTLDKLIKKEDTKSKLSKILEYSNDKQELIVKELLVDCDPKSVASKLKIDTNTVYSQVRHIRNKLKGKKW